jgi:dipeptidyl aminopeptidase/acylaminoacyl peptidase
MKYLIIAILLGASTASAQDLQVAKARAASAPRAPLIARDAFMRRQAIVDVRLSPDGRYVSFVRRGDRGLDVVMQNISSRAEKRLITGLQRAETAWSGDGKRLWVADEQGLAVIESANLSARRVLKWDARVAQRFWAVDPRATQHVIIRENGKSAQSRHRYLTVNQQGQKRLLLETALPVRSMLLDAQGDIAFTAAFEGASYQTVVRDHTGPKPREKMRCGMLEECRLVGYNVAQKTVWLLSQHGSDKLELRRMRQGSDRWERVHHDPADIADADEMLWSAGGEEWLGIAYHAGRRRWYGSTARDRALLSAVQRHLPDANLRFSATRDGSMLLVQAQQADQSRDRYYIHRTRQNQLQPLFTGDDVKSAAPRGVVMHPLSYRARDGMMLYGYVMLPPGTSPAKAPLVTWVHGGPIARIDDHYDAVLQMLVNRGYAVFIPNFRGSTGYGVQYMLAAKGDVGNGRVLADIIDGIDYVLAQGIGDRQRQAVMGISFGGYASLLALTHHPKRFRFAFVAAPPTEYGWIKQWQAEHDSEAIRGEGPPLSLQFPQLGFRYGDPAWREKMRRESPLANVQALGAPAYLWAGARDDHVPLKSIVNYVSNARKLGKQVSLFIDPNGGHVPQNALGNQALLYQIELAAHRHLGGALSPASPALKAFIDRNLRVNGATSR